MNPLFRIDFSISDSLKIVRKSVLIYETIIVSMQEQETEASRFLSALEKKHAQSRQQVADAISFGQYRKDGGSDV